jgi:antitoxin (DNA-binding transcriptional repressor) of toxin-antitoxin stability system
MKFLTVRELKTQSASSWQRLAAERELVVTSNGRPIAILSAVDEDCLEESLAAIRQARAVSAVLETQRSSAMEGRDRLSDDEIAAEISDYRREAAVADRGP